MRALLPCGCEIPARPTATHLAHIESCREYHAPAPHQLVTGLEADPWSQPSQALHADQPLADADALATAHFYCACPACKAAAGQPCLFHQRPSAPAPAIEPPFRPLPPDLYRIKEAARLTGITQYTIRRWIRTGKIATYGRPMMFHVSLAELMPRRVKAGAEPDSTCYLRFHKSQVSAPSI